MLTFFLGCLCAVLFVFWSGPAVSPCLPAAFDLLCLGSCVSSFVRLAPAVFFSFFCFFRVVGAVPRTGKYFRYPFYDTAGLHHFGQCEEVGEQCILWKHRTL